MNTRTLCAAMAYMLIVIGTCAPAAASAANRATALDRPWLDRPITDARVPAAPGRAGPRSQFSATTGAPSTQPGLPGARENFEVVSKLEPKGPGGAFGDVEDGQIADLAVHKGFAYLNSSDDADCKRGGVHVVDVNDPANPKETGFIPAIQPYYHGEGAQALSIATPQFTGDLLAVNNETYSAVCGGLVKGGGGFDLYDVSDPKDPKVLVQIAGDKSPDGSLEQSTAPAVRPKSYHSVFVWQDGPRAYLVGVDNTELADVDIFDITDPKRPAQIGDYDLVERFPEILEGEEGNGGNVFSHDAVVKRIGGRMVLLADYWDAGYVQLDVTDPKNPTRVTDTVFKGVDPLFPADGLSPEGNAHQGEFSADGQFLLAADEDFNAFRTVAKAVGGGSEQRFDLLEGVDSARIADLPDGELNGGTTFIGTACSADTTPTAPADDRNASTDDVALIERGVCGFAIKVEQARRKGWDAVIAFNDANRPDGDAFIDMNTGGATIPAAFTLRAIALGTAQLPGVLLGAARGATPAVGARGRDVSVATVFDGWGYAHLYDARTSEELDAYAIPEALDERYAGGNGPASSFGDLSIHEFATDPDTNLAYASYYAGGLRAFAFSRGEGLVPTAKFVDPEGSNFWGVEQFTTADGQRLIAGSDRDFGLVILKYTGPGAERAGRKPGLVPAAPPAPPAAPGRPAGPVANTDSTFTVTRPAFRRNRFTVTFTTKGPGISSTELTAVIGGKRTRIARRAVLLTRAGRTTYTVRLTSGESVRLRRAIRRTRAKRLTGTVRTAFTARGRTAGKTRRSTITLR